MIKLHNIFKLVFGFAMVEFCRFFYFQYNTGPSYSRLSPSAPSISAENQKLLGITPSSKYTGDIKGLNYDKDAATYSPSMAYLSSLKRSQTPYVPFSAAQFPGATAGYNPSLLSSVYTPASANNNLLASLPAGAPMYGAGRFLDSGLLNMPINFSLGESTGEGE